MPENAAAALSGEAIPKTLDAEDHMEAAAGNGVDAVSNGILISNGSDVSAAAAGAAADDTTLSKECPAASTAIAVN